jgi:hypothetical protein
MTKQISNGKQHREEIQECRLAATLQTGPKTLDEILDIFYGYLKVIGFFKLAERNALRKKSFIQKRLETLLERGWVELEDERYKLTPTGQGEVEKRSQELGRIGETARQFLSPQTVSKVTLGVHLGLVAIKLPVAILSGSVGLLNDAADTLLDAVSSTLVYFGLRFNKERAVNVVLVMLMLTTGSFTFYEAVRRFFIAASYAVTGITFLAVILSGLICLGLWTVQRYVGLKSSSIALVTQSVDSRNHVIVAASVTVGLIASWLKFPLLDILVGLTVSILILKNAVELTIESIRSLREAQVDLSSYEFGLAIQFEKFRESQLRDWMLYLAGKEGIGTHAELVQRGRQAIDSSHLLSFQALGLAPQEPPGGEIPEQSLAELVKRGWIGEGEPIQVTKAGQSRIRRLGLIAI